MIFSAGSYGTNTARVIQVVFGMEVISDESDSRSYRAFYPKNWSSHLFGVVVMFSTHGEFERFNNWMQGYGEKAADPNSGIGEMRVYSTNPARNFDKTGVLQNGVTFGDQVAKITWSVAYNFVGARDTAENNTLGFDPLKQVTITDADSAFYYPTGNQLSAASSVQDGLYTAQANAVAEKLRSQINKLN